MTAIRTKQVSIYAAAGLYSLFFFLFLALIMRGGGLSIGAGTVLALVAGLVWVALLGASAAFLAQYPGSKAILSLIPLPAVFIASGFRLEGLIGGILLSLFTLAGIAVIDKRLQQLVQLKIGAVFARGTRTIIIGLLAALLALSLPAVRQYVSNGDLLIPEEGIAVVLRPLAPLLSQYLPGYTEHSTIDDILRRQIDKQLTGLPEGVTIAPNEQARLRQDLAQQLGVPLSGQETLPQVLARVFNQYLRNAADQSGLIVIIMLIAAAFLALRAVVPVLAWPAVGIIYLLVKLAQRIGLVQITKTQVTIERLHL